MVPRSSVAASDLLQYGGSRPRPGRRATCICVCANALRSARRRRPYSIIWPPWADRLAPTAENRAQHAAQNLPAKFPANRPGDAGAPRFWRRLRSHLRGVRRAGRCCHPGYCPDCRSRPPSLSAGAGSGAAAGCGRGALAGRASAPGAAGAGIAPGAGLGGGRLAAQDFVGRFTVDGLACRWRAAARPRRRPPLGFSVSGPRRDAGGKMRARSTMFGRPLSRRGRRPAPRRRRVR